MLISIQDSEYQELMEIKREYEKIKIEMERLWRLYENVKNEISWLKDLERCSDSTDCDKMQLRRLEIIFK